MTPRNRSREVRRVEALEEDEDEDESASDADVVCIEGTAGADIWSPISDRRELRVGLYYGAEGPRTRFGF